MQKVSWFGGDKPGRDFFLRVKNHSWPGESKVRGVGGGFLPLSESKGCKDTEIHDCKGVGVMVSTLDGCERGLDKFMEDMSLLKV